MLELHFIEKRSESILYSDTSIGTEHLYLYINKPIEQFDGKRLALVEGDYNSKLIHSFLKSKGIDPEVTYVKSYNEARQLVTLEQVDVAIGTSAISNFKNFHPIHHYTSGSVYIGANMNNQELMSQINQQLQKYESLSENPIDLIYQEYIPNQSNSKLLKRLQFIAIICFIVVPILVFYPKLKHKIVRYYIRRQIEQNRYIPFYQPIINSHTNEISGLEALIRFNHRRKGILGSHTFIDKFEKYDMSNELTLYLMQRIINDYSKIKDLLYFRKQGNNFYISLNVSAQ